MNAPGSGGALPRRAAVAEWGDSPRCRSPNDSVALGRPGFAVATGTQVQPQTDFLSTSMLPSGLSPRKHIAFRNCLGNMGEKSPGRREF